MTIGWQLDDHWMTWVCLNLWSFGPQLPLPSPPLPLLLWLSRQRLWKARGQRSGRLRNHRNDAFGLTRWHRWVPITMAGPQVQYARISIYEMIWNLWHPPTDNHKYVSCNMLQHTVACSKQHQTLFVTRTGLLHQRRLGPPPMLLAQPKCDKASRWKCGYDDMVWWRPIAKKAWALVAQILKEAPDVSRPPKWS